MSNLTWKIRSLQSTMGSTYPWVRHGYASMEKHSAKSLCSDSPTCYPCIQTCWLGISCIALASDAILLLWELRPTCVTRTLPDLLVFSLPFTKFKFELIDYRNCNDTGGRILEKMADCRYGNNRLLLINTKSLENGKAARINGPQW